MARTLSISVGINERGIRKMQRELELLPQQMARVAQSAANATSIDARKRAKASSPRFSMTPAGYQGCILRAGEAWAASAT